MGEIGEDPILHATNIFPIMIEVGLGFRKHLKIFGNNTGNFI